ncbi:MAG: methyl-accepting chemotaxis protein [Allorhizobium sp.]
MLKLLERLSFRSLLTTLAVVPLLAVVVLGGWLIWNSYSAYQSLVRADTLQRLAFDAGRLAQLVPAESGASADKRGEYRALTDEAYRSLASAYDAVVDAGYHDDALAKMKAALDQRYARISEFRTKTDDGTAAPLLALEILQPLVGASADVTRRAGVLSEDQDLARAVAGYYAFMQVSDGYQILNRLGQQYIKTGPLDYPAFAMLHRAQNHIKNFSTTFVESVPADILDTYNSYWTKPNGLLIEGMRAKMLENGPYAGSEAELATWIAAMNDRRVFAADLIGKAGARMGEMVEAKRSRALGQFQVLVAVLVSIVAFAVFMSVVVTRGLSGSIKRIGERMTGLAAGDVLRPIPYVGRKDEIGDMARSVEVFRQAAIRNSELEASAEQNRLAAEQERADVQRRAEAEAEERLIQATGSLASGLRQLASGDLVCEIDEQFAPQFETLRHDFNASVQQLREAMRSVGQVVGSVTNGSGEISQASDNLAKRTEQQAASLEETAAALEEITSNVTATSKRTGEARDLVRTTREQAEKSGTVVNNAVSAMEKIEHSSRQISQIIGVIDEIAFQTNLLALNAGVEAARAGDAGKGFAVVAQEVRELAQRSANAAKEIKGLIGNSEVAVNEGVKLVNDTGEGLNTIAGLVQAINAHMDAIATAAQEQSVGLGEVNTAVNHMDQATQQNAAMVEEMNAAGASLAQESGRLAELVARFRTGESVMVQQKPAETAKTPAAAQRRPVPIEPSSRPALATRARPAAASLGNTAVATKIEDWEEF